MDGKRTNVCTRRMKTKTRTAVPRSQGNGAEVEAYPGFLTAPKAGKQTGLIKRQDLQEEGGNLKVIYFILLSLNAKSLPVNC